MPLTLYVSVSHVFTVLGKGILEILCCFQLNKCLSTGTAFFRVGKTHSVYFPHNVTVCKQARLIEISLKGCLLREEKRTLKATTGSHLICTGLTFRKYNPTGHHLLIHLRSWQHSNVWSYVKFEISRWGNSLENVEKSPPTTVKTVVHSHKSNVD